MSVEVDPEVFYILHGPEFCLAVFGHKVVMIDGDISYQIDGPPLIGLVAQIGLIVEKGGAIFAFCL